MKIFQRLRDALTKETPKATSTVDTEVRLEGVDEEVLKGQAAMNIGKHAERLFKTVDQTMGSVFGKGGLMEDMFKDLNGTFDQVKSVHKFTGSHAIKKGDRVVIQGTEVRHATSADREVWEVTNCVETTVDGKTKKKFTFKKLKL